MNFEDATGIVVWGVVALSLVGVILGISTDGLINFLLPLGISFMLSAFVGEVIEKFTGDFFKDKYLSFPIGKFQVNIPLMIILTLILKTWWFG
jgi:hypothetical protein